MNRIVPLFLSLIASLFVSACATSSPDMFGANRSEVSQGGLDFVVFHDSVQAEVMRMGYLGRAERVRVPELMTQAAAQASGCRVIPDSMTTRLPGDTGVARFDLDC